MKTLVICYGNPLRSDDGLGWHAGRLLAQLLSDQNVEVITCHQLTPEIAELLSGFDRALFVDADCRGVPGEVLRQDLQPCETSSQSFTHSCTPSGLLASAEKLYGRRPQAVAITVSAQTFDFGDSLSPVVAAALPDVVEQVRQFLGVNFANPPHEVRN